jgi:hypothetical protein
MPAHAMLLTPAPALLTVAILAVAILALALVLPLARGSMWTYALRSAGNFSDKNCCRRTVAHRLH